MPQVNVTFAAPPVVEMLLSVQFSPLAGYSSAHAGWFWKDYVQKLTPEPWPSVVEVPRLEDQFERFGAEEVWSPVSFKVFQGVQSPRVQLIRADGERMIQLQDTRFVLNWRKQSSAYPTYSSLLPEFSGLINAFEVFCREAALGAPQYNQWEVAYVDHLKKGELWSSVRDWARIFPAFSMPSVGLKNAEASSDESMSADWRYTLTGKRGRMYMSLRHARIPPTQEEIMQLTMTARGPVTSNSSWEAGFSIGHDALAEAFLQLSSAEAHKHWKKGA